jgi:hypothetical protein
MNYYSIVLGLLSIASVANADGINSFANIAIRVKGSNQCLKVSSAGQGAKLAMGDCLDDLAIIRPINVTNHPGQLALMYAGPNGKCVHIAAGGATNVPSTLGIYDGCTSKDSQLVMGPDGKISSQINPDFGFQVAGNDVYYETNCNTFFEQIIIGIGSGRPCTIGAEECMGDLKCIAPTGSNAVCGKSE